MAERDGGMEQGSCARVISIESVGDLPAMARGAIVTVGNFDGVHLGHQRLLAHLRAQADSAGVPALAITFDPHPVALLRPEAAPVPLVWLEREIALLQNAGASLVGVFRTGPWLLKLPAREFFEQVIRRQLAPRGIVEGPNFAFGHDRGGNVTSLAAWCREEAIDFEIVEGAAIEGRLVSSSLIRGCLTEGRVEEAARYLGRPHRIRGRVVPGARRGATLGFPTVNLAEIDAMVPAQGVYAGLAWIDGDGPAWPAACHLGPNPTFSEHATKVEAHLIGFEGDLYRRLVELEFLERLRGIQAFSGRDELLRQITQDVDQTHRICGARR